MSQRDAVGSYAEISGDAFRAIAARMLAMRVLFGPIWLAFLLWVAIADPALWRRAVLVGCLATAVLVGIARWARRGRNVEPRAELRLGILVAPASLAAVCAATGGLLSPFVAFFFLLVLVAHGLAPAEGQRPLGLLTATALLGLGAAHVLGAPLVPAVFLDATGAPAALYFAIAAVMMLVALIIARGIAGALWARGDEMLRRSLRARDEALDTHRERMMELSAYSAELAHELKNPLASIKGLASLAALEPSRAAERLEVLRGEIERMQAILEEHLDFTRPLAPLILAEVDLGALATDVANLYEAELGRRGARLEVVGTASVARGDRRKLKQVLINLVENALDATPSGGLVRIECNPRGPSGAEATLRVLDDGPGLDPAARGRLGETGVTTKAHGSGLGLAMVRACVEQHGGRFELTERPEGGCVAAVMLPVEGPRGVA